MKPVELKPAEVEAKAHARARITQILGIDLTEQLIGNALSMYYLGYDDALAEHGIVRGKKKTEDPA